ncbi:hypothetical protein OG562_01265 [Streptomyces sp. NBC_01275]|uniref:hypothetical protein n=1 Tax=Streptomyces sp. NBC_01275 TaxID=2903807 RepID=UPI0022516465|nr:hypothetical protein [Streptomyces sp. NBC_01275]MCX4759638.1 hypothetical protein [Streptomyces sp. NBC_01275]
MRAQSEQARQAALARARTVRDGGMSAVPDAIVSVATSEATRNERPLAAAMVRELLLGQDPESARCALTGGAGTSTPRRPKTAGAGKPCAGPAGRGR